MSEERKYIAHSKIFDCWKDKAITANGSVVDETGDPATVPVVEYWTEPCCWACGRQVFGLEEYATYESNLSGGKVRILYNYGKTRSTLERCHIVPHALGGSDRDPSNLFLLCHECHASSPDMANPKYFLRWVYKMRTEKVFVGDRVRIDVHEVMELLKKEAEFWGKDLMSGNVHGLGENAVKHAGGSYISTIVSSYLESCQNFSEK